MARVPPISAFTAAHPATLPDLLLPDGMKPADGRFGSGPSKVPAAAVAALAASGSKFLGTSHRQAPVRSLVQRVRESLAAFFELPDGYEVALGNGGSTLFWDLAAFSLVEHRAQHAAFGEFSTKFAAVTARAPWLGAPTVRRADPGSATTCVAEDGVDVYAWPHNETSTGVAVEVTRVPGADDGALMVVDGTSGAGGLPLDPAQADVYYFAPQKSFASDGGLWLALLSPAGIERAERIAATDRFVPESLDLAVAIGQSRQNQTLNTPAVATLFLLVEQAEAMLAAGGLPWATARTAESAATVYGWAENTAYTTPFVADPSHRSAVVATVDLAAEIDAPTVARVLRANGIVDVEPYRKLGRNQLRIALYPAIDPADVAALTGCIDWVVDRLG
jgi:phosphoserine aminotransferase